MRQHHSFPFILFLLALSCSPALATDSFRVATYNVENYLDQPTESRPHSKSADARAKIRESIRALNPDVLALEEMGNERAHGIAQFAQGRGSGFSLLGIGQRRGHEYPRRRVEQIAHRRAPPAHERGFPARRPPVSRQPRVRRTGHPGRARFYLHAHRRAFEIAPACARSRRSRATPAGSKNPARHRGQAISPLIRMQN